MPSETITVEETESKPISVSLVNNQDALDEHLRTPSSLDKVSSTVRTTGMMTTATSVRSDSVINNLHSLPEMSITPTDTGFDLSGNLFSVSLTSDMLTSSKSLPLDGIEVGWNTLLLQYPPLSPPPVDHLPKYVPMKEDSVSEVQDNNNQVKCSISPTLTLALNTVTTMNKGTPDMPGFVSPAGSDVPIASLMAVVETRSTSMSTTTFLNTNVSVSESRDMSRDDNPSNLSSVAPSSVNGMIPTGVSPEIAPPTVIPIAITKLISLPVVSSMNETNRQGSAGISMATMGSTSIDMPLFSMPSSLTPDSTVSAPLISPIPRHSSSSHNESSWGEMSTSVPMLVDMAQDCIKDRMNDSRQISRDASNGCNVHPDRQQELPIVFPAENRVIGKSIDAAPLEPCTNIEVVDADVDPGNDGDSQSVTTKHPSTDSPNATASNKSTKEICSVCNSFVQHLAAHLNYGHICCSVCFEKFSSLKDMETHQMEKHQIIKECCFCKVNFSEWNELHDHIRIDHNTDIMTCIREAMVYEHGTTSDTALNICKKCNYSSLDDDEMFIHLAYTHVKCMMCNVFLQDTFTLSRHMALCHGIHVCPFCKTREKWWLDLKQHIDWFHWNRMSDHDFVQFLRGCSLCKTTFQTPDGLRQHVKVKHYGTVLYNNLMLKCVSCSFKCMYVQELEKHSSSLRKTSNNLKGSKKTDNHFTPTVIIDQSQVSNVRTEACEMDSESWEPPSDSSALVSNAYDSVEDRNIPCDLHHQHGQEELTDIGSQRIIGKKHPNDQENNTVPTTPLNSFMDSQSQQIRYRVGQYSEHVNKPKSRQKMPIKKARSRVRRANTFTPPIVTSSPDVNPSVRLDDSTSKQLRVRGLLRSDSPLYKTPVWRTPNHNARSIRPIGICTPVENRTSLNAKLSEKQEGNISSNNYNGPPPPLKDPSNYRPDESNSSVLRRLLEFEGEKGNYTDNNGNHAKGSERLGADQNRIQESTSVFQSEMEQLYSEVEPTTTKSSAKSREKLRCTVCQETFLYLHQLAQHVRLTHSPTTDGIR